MKELVEAIETTPIIDHHAHNLLSPHVTDKYDLLSITSEANGSSLQTGAPSTLAHLRAVHQLSKILACEANWANVKAAIEQKRKEPDDAWARQCFHGIETVLIDDGLDPSDVHPYDWHDRLTRSPCKRIVRIEKVAEEIMSNAYEDFRKKFLNEPSAFTHHVLRRFTTAIEQAIGDSEVVGFKSVICYRTGLDISGFNDNDQDKLNSIFRSKDFKKFARLEDDQLGPYFLHLAARLIESSKSRKPLQFHTGLGDNDISLRLSNPSYLQDFIKTYPSLPIVLLHASYPFTREAAYLANVYSNVWLDIGEIFPCLSQDGQENAVRNALDLCPFEKLMWSTDGHWFPETYLLAVIQVREALRTVLPEYVDRGALTVSEAVKVTQDILFDTSNRLYRLGLSSTPAGPRDLSTVDSKIDWSVNVAHFKSFLSRHPSIRYIKLQFLDYTSTLRVRVLPIKEALKMFSGKKFVEITRAVFGLLQDDHICPGFSATFVYNLYPVSQSLHLGYRAGYASLQGEFQYEDGSEVPMCPRTVLRKQLERAKTHNMTFLIGFEVEMVFMSADVEHGGFRYGGRPINDGGHCWSSNRAFQSDAMMDLLETIHAKLEVAGVDLQQFHPESCSGQYEFVLGPQPPLEAVDSLIVARDIISSCAASVNMRATLYPKPFPTAPGTGAHMHISVTPVEEWKSFAAGILKHMQAIAAFSYSQDASYERVANGVWAGSTWIAWGSQNRETPLRRVDGSHFEVRCIDGLSNPYLVVAAVIGAGAQGIIDREPLLMRDCVPDPSTLSATEKKEHGITKQFPKGIIEALSYLEQDEGLCKILGKQVVETYVTVKRNETEMLKGMEPAKRREWLIERY
ncbi:hypothetical protein ACLMJK_000657 [Lecanora helva]